VSERRPQTIQFFLPQGEPRGIRIAEITTRIVQGVYVPRSKLVEASDRKELRGVGVYFLFGLPEEAAKPMCYIGEAEDCLVRLRQHNASKDFWQQAIAIVSKTNSFTKAHVRYLEWYCIRKAKEISRFNLENANSSGEPFVTEPMRADLMDAFDTLNVLISALGFPLLEARPEAAGVDLFFVTGPDCEGRGQLVEDGFTVLAGSKARKQAVASAGKWLEAMRQELLSGGVLAEDGNQFVFKEDHTFSTPSSAAVALLGRNANGWTEWKNRSGSTLDAMKRPQSTDDDASRGTGDCTEGD
jgi:uncharacterized protein DUF4357